MAGGDGHRRRRGVPACATFAATAAALCAAACAPEPPRPSVVLFVVDTLRADRLGAYGDETARTPQIDALAAESAVFDDASAPAPWTLPSVVSLLTSTFPCEHGVLVDGDVLPDSIGTLAERFRDAGYATASAYGNPYAGPMSGLDRGFFLAEFRIGSRGATVKQTLDGFGGSPFFLYVHNEEPHDPYSEKLFIPEYRVDDETRNLVNQHLQRLRELGRADFEAGRPVGATDNTERQDRRMRSLSRYAPEIRELYAKDVAIADHRVGSVVAELKRRGVWDRTLFVLASDHGEEFGEHGGWQHDQSAYEELLRVPLVVHFPGGRFAGTRVAAPVSLVDVVPTIADALDMPVLAEGARGRSLMPLLEGGAGDADARITAMRANEKKYYRPWKERRGDVNVVVRDGDWKAIYNAERDSVELYDLARDPVEQTDLAERDAARAAAMKERAARWYAACAPAPPAATRRVEPTAEEAEQLRALGYAD